MPAVAQTAAPVIVYDPALSAVVPSGARAITGDPVRFAKALFADRPGLVIGISRHADALLIADVAREAGYRPAAAPAAFGSFGWALARKG